MYRYIIKRVLLVIPTLLGAAALVFVLMRLIPGDVCVVRLGSGGNTLDPKAIALCHAELGTFAEGRALGEEGLQIAEALAHPYSLSWAYHGLGLLSLRQGDL